MYAVEGVCGSEGSHRERRCKRRAADGRKLSIWQTGSCCDCGSSQQLFCSLPLTARDKWPLKSHDHLIHRSLVVNCALKLLAGTRRSRRRRSSALLHCKHIHCNGSLSFYRASGRVGRSLSLWREIPQKPERSSVAVAVR